MSKQRSFAVRSLIAVAVASGVATWFTEHVFTPLKQSNSPQERVAAAAEELRSFYAGGARSCVMDMLSIPGGGEELAAGLKGALEAWVEAFAGIAEESGFSAEEALRRAEDAIMRIEGSLVLSRVLGQPKPFERALEDLPKMLIK